MARTTCCAAPMFLAKGTGGINIHGMVLAVKKDKSVSLVAFLCDGQRLVIKAAAHETMARDAFRMAREPIISARFAFSFPRLAFLDGPISDQVKLSMGRKHAEDSGLSGPPGGEKTKRLTFPAPTYIFNQRRRFGRVVSKL